MSAAVSEAHVRTFIESLDLYAKHGGTLISQNDADMLADDLRLILSERQEGSGALPASPSGGQGSSAAPIPTEGEGPSSGQLRPLDDWHEDYGDVLWWHPGEAPWVGTPLDLGRGYELGIADFSTVVHLGGWPGYHEWWTPLPATPSVGMEPKAECAQPSRSDILEHIRAFDFGAYYGEAEYERLADDLEALAQPNQPRDREEG